MIGRSPDSAYSTPARENSADDKSSAGAWSASAAVFVVVSVHVQFTAHPVLELYRSREAAPLTLQGC